MNLYDDWKDQFDSLLPEKKEKEYQGIFISTEKIEKEIIKKKRLCFLDMVYDKDHKIIGTKFYACSKEENFENPIFKLIYTNKEIIFQKLEGTGVDYADDYIAKKFSDWEEQGSYPDSIGKDEEYVCIVLEVNRPEGSGVGWTEKYPLKCISINWPYRKKKGWKSNQKNLLWKGDNIITNLKKISQFKNKQIDIIKMKQKVVMSGYKWNNEHIFCAMSWRNEKIRKIGEKFPTYQDYDFLGAYESSKVGIVKKQYQINSKQEQEFPLSEICDDLYREVAIKHNYGFGRRRKGVKKTIRKSFSESHTSLLEMAAVNKLKLVWDKRLFGENVKELLTSNNSYITRLLNSIYEIAASRTHSDLSESPRWLILSDEKWIHVDGRKEKLALMYSIIPPRADGAANTSAFYHSAQKLEFSEETLLLQKNIVKNKNIFNFSFLISDKGLTGENIASAVSNTFPIVVEILRNKIASEKSLFEGDLKVQFLSERIDDNEFIPGVDIIIETSNEMKERYKERGGVQFKKYLPFDLLPKYPNSHPFLQYPDIIGKKYQVYGNHEKHAESDPEYLESIQEFEGNVETFKQLKKLILRTKNPLDFFKILIESKNKYITDYCLNPAEKPYHKSEYHHLVLGELIRENIKYLHEREELEQLFTLIYDNTEEVGSRDIIRNILIEVYRQNKNNEILPKYKLTTRNKFEWLMQVFSYQIHNDNIEVVFEVKKLLEQIQDENEYDYIGPSRIMDLKCLQLVSNQNVFSFGESSQLLEDIERLINQKHTSQREDNYVGAMALNLLLQNNDVNSDKIKIAEKAENYLHRKIIHDKTDPSIIRRITNLLEMKILKSSISPNSRVVEDDEKISLEVLEEIYYNKEIYLDYLSSPYFTSAVLKAIALTDYNRMDAEQVKLREFAENILLKHIFIRKGHYWPNNRIAYWYIRACCSVNLNNSEDCHMNMLACTQLLFKMNFEHKSAIGLITACQLLDLFYRHGSLGDKAYSIFNFSETELIKWEPIFWGNYETKVNYLLEKSWEPYSTQKWFEDNKPDKLDRLKPLNFNYR